MCVDFSLNCTLKMVMMHRATCILPQLKNSEKNGKDLSQQLVLGFLVLQPQGVVGMFRGRSGGGQVSERKGGVGVSRCRSREGGFEGPEQGEACSPSHLGLLPTWRPKWVGGCRRLTANTAVFKLCSAGTTLRRNASFLPCEN